MTEHTIELLRQRARIEAGLRCCGFDYCVAQIAARRHGKTVNALTPAQRDAIKTELFDVLDRYVKSIELSDEIAFMRDVLDD